MSSHCKGMHGCVSSLSRRRKGGLDMIIDLMLLRQYENHATSMQRGCMLGSDFSGGVRSQVADVLCRAVLAHIH